MTDSPNNDEVQNKITNDFKKKVMKWVELDDEVRTLRERIKVITKEKKQDSEFILSFLENIGEKELAISDGKLRRNVSKSKAPLKKEHIQNAINQLIKDKEKAVTMTDHIINSRPVVERVNLKRTKNRKNK